LVTPALGTPASGVVTNLTGTASININGTVGATTPAAGAFTTLSATGVTTVQAGTVSAPAITTTGDTNTGIFFPAADTIAFAEGGAEAMRIDSAQNVTVSAGNLVIGTSGKGIDFSATPGTGTSELFADYEEGDFTPTFFYGATEVGYYSRGGKYTKIGRQVFCEISGYFLRDAGAAKFGGLPFTSANFGGQPDLHPGTTGRDYPLTTDFTGYVNKGTTTGDLNYSYAGAGDSEIRMFVTYFV
jgi:hypothetical protein